MSLATVPTAVTEQDSELDLIRKFVAQFLSAFPSPVASLNGTPGFSPLAADPGSPSEGQTWYNTTTHLFKGYANGAVKTFTVS